MGVSILATQTNLQLLLAKGPLGSLSNAAILNGRLAIGIDSNKGRAKLIIDDNGERYEFQPLWSEIIDAPTMSDYLTIEAHNNIVTDLNNSIADKVDKNNGIAKDLGIAASLTDGAAKAVLTYNDSTQSLDFNFT